MEKSFGDQIENQLRSVIRNSFSTIVEQLSTQNTVFSGMKATMLKENLILATKLKSKKDLQKAVKDYMDSGLPSSDCDELNEAARELDVLRTRDGEWEYGC